jgi:hypothetical protein
LGATRLGRARADSGVAPPTTQVALLSADNAAELARLQRENERLRMDATF